MLYVLLPYLYNEDENPAHGAVVREKQGNPGKAAGT